MELQTEAEFPKHIILASPPPAHRGVIAVLGTPQRLEIQKLKASVVMLWSLKKKNLTPALLLFNSEKF